MESLLATDLASYIDHTLLKPEATPAEIQQLCAEARSHHFASVCVNPSYVPLCAKLLAGSNVAVCTVIGFPLGAASTAAKVCEARQALDDGAQELDMVIHIGMLKAGNADYVETDIRQVADLARQRGALTKVIIEAVLLADAEKALACTLAKKAGADFVKTSTGFSKGGATVTDVALMRKTVGPSMGVKAAGGIRSRADAAAMIAAGATRIGTSSGVKIIEGDAR